VNPKNDSAFQKSPTQKKTEKKRNFALLVPIQTISVSGA
jgi:hypothetical protein